MLLGTLNDRSNHIKTTLRKLIADQIPAFDNEEDRCFYYRSLALNVIYLIDDLEKKAKDLREELADWKRSYNTLRNALEQQSSSGNTFPTKKPTL